MGEKRSAYVQIHRRTLLGGSVIVLGLAAVVLMLITIRNRAPEKAPASQPVIALSSVVTKVKFALYYPVRLPNGYSLRTESVQTNANIVFFQFQKGTDTIFISEQASPAVPPDFDQLIKVASYKKIDTPLGSSVIGINEQKVAAFLLTNTTLISYHCSDKVPSDLVISLVKSMSSL